jgi:hypothetical protein
MASFGVTEESQAFENLVVKDGVYNSLLLDSTATCAIGQVVQYDQSANNFVNYTSADGATQYAVVAEAKSLSGDTQCLCLVRGEVRLSELDSTAQADAEIVVALNKSGITVREDAIQ